jgi:non-ribosomal peptide synthase protein (TIGR01720 family)
MSANLLRRTICELLNHHDALRMKFRRIGSEWRQRYGEETTEVPFDALYFGDTEGSHAAALMEAANRLHGSLDLENGPLLRVALFDLGARKRQCLLLTIHHLVIDVVSWRVLFEDLQAVYENLECDKEACLPSKTSSFQSWSQRLLHYAHSRSAQEELDYWQNQSWSESFSIPVDHTGINNMASLEQFTSSLDASDTETLLKAVPRVQHTQINDVLLTALSRALGRWTGAGHALLDLEGHGRESFMEEADVSRTVGWFTSIFPVQLQTDIEEDPQKHLLATKEYLRSIPNHGAGYGVLRYLAGQKSPSFRLSPLIGFNYIGRIEDELADDSMFEVSAYDVGQTCSKTATRLHLIDIAAGIRHGSLYITWIFSRNVHRFDTIARVANLFIDELRSLIRHLTATLLPEQKAGTHWVTMAPMQRWFFDLDIKARNQYTVSIYRKCKNVFIPQLLEQSVAFVIDHHEALRFRFVQTSAGWHQFSKPRPDCPIIERIEVAYAEGDGAATKIAEMRQRLQSSVNIEEGLLLRVGLVDFGAQGQRLLLVGHHLVFDPISIGIVLEDIQTAYDCLAAGNQPRLPYSTTSFSKWTEQLDEYQQSPRAYSELTHWRNMCWSANARLPRDYPNGSGMPVVRETIAVHLNAAETVGLLETAPARFRASTAEILAATLLFALGEWSGSRVLSVIIVDSGRQDIGNGTDVTRTVGWFSKDYPLLLDARAACDIKETIDSVARALRDKPIGRIAFDALGVDPHVAPPEVTFNYQGIFARDLEVQGNDEFLQEIELASTPFLRPNTLLEVSGAVIDSQLTLHCAYNASIHHAQTIVAVAARCLSALRDLNSESARPEAGAGNV